MGKHSKKKKSQVSLLDWVELFESLINLIATILTLIFNK